MEEDQKHGKFWGSYGVKCTLHFSWKQFLF